MKHVAEPQPYATLKPWQGRDKSIIMSDCHIRACRAATLIWGIALLTGCAKTPVSGTFVDQMGSTTVAMIRVVEAPPGHLMGSMVVTALNRDGATESKIYSVSGSIDRPNVSLKLGGGLVGLARLFGTDTVLAGNLRGTALTLSIGSSTAVFHEVADTAYQQDLVRLNVVGGHIALVRQSTIALEKAVQDGHLISTRLQQYMTWGQTRISRIPRVRAWYANRIRHYRMCLNYIRPLAAANVPAWRWQECALNVATDKYYRDQEIANLRTLQNQNRQGVARLDVRISRARVQFAHATELVRSSCRYRGADSGKCLSAVKKLQAMMPYGFINRATLSEFQGLVPKVKGALDEDIHTGSAGEARLSDIAQEVAQIYQSASTQ